MSLKQVLRVLVVDDTSVSRALICDALDQLGLKNVSIARDSVDAIRAMTEQPSHLVISDLHMPKLDGLGLLRAIREYEPLRRTAFILVTGRDDPEVIARGKQLRMNNYLIKPFTVAQVKTKIEAVVGSLD
jgi:two-component system, chemotaxis family, chemotaxis protein CheY